jgi:hypothetical protein
MHSDRARYYAEAEALFRKKDDARPQATRAREEYLARQRALREKTERLRALRLARERGRKA